MVALKSWISPDLLPGESDVEFDGRVLLFTAALVPATGVFFEWLRRSTALRRDWRASLKEGGRAATSGVDPDRFEMGWPSPRLPCLSFLYEPASLIRSLYQLQRSIPGSTLPT
jgi:hypothetical protein